jgi:APA family basic amino acid/polyamine antiporter
VGIYTFSVPRIFYALAEDGLFFPAVARIHPRFKTPVNAILLQSGWAMVLLFIWGTFDAIINYLVFMDGIFMLLTGLGIMKLRRTRPAAERPYRTLGYPVTPILFILMSLFFIGATLINKPVQAVAAIVACVLGLPFYAYFSRRKRAAGAPSAV